MSIAFEQSKKELLDTIGQMKQKTKADADVIEKAIVVVYGAASPFVDGLLDTLRKQFEVEFFTNAEDASNYCFEHLSYRLILAMDAPTDWKMATDVFTTVKMMRPDMQVFLSTKSPNSVPIQTLAAQKATILAIPFSVDILFHKLKFNS